VFSELRHAHHHHWVIGITLFILLLLVIAKWNKVNYIQHFGASLFSNLYFTAKFSEKRRIDLPEVTLFIASLLALALFLYVVFIQGVFDVFAYLRLSLLVLVILLGKYFIEKIIGDVFELHQLLNKYLFFKQGVLSWLSLFVLFPVALLIYFQHLYSSSLLLGVVVFCALIYTIKLTSFFGIYQKPILAYWFYFILYLCAFEIAPYLILFKVIKSID